MYVVASCQYRVADGPTELLVGVGFYCCYTRSPHVEVDSCEELVLVFRSCCIGLLPRHRHRPKEGDCSLVGLFSLRQKTLTIDLISLTV